MSIIPKLATSLNRRDEVPNQQVAIEIVRRHDTRAIAELIENLANKNKGIRHDCIKVLYEVGYAKPGLIAGYGKTFLELLANPDNRLQWGAMTALGCIASETPDNIYAALPKIIDAADRGSVITRDQCVSILITLSVMDKYADETFPLLLEQMMTCPPNQLPMYAENAIPIVNPVNREAFVKVLASRLDELKRKVSETGWRKSSKRCQNKRPPIESTRPVLARYSNVSNRGCRDTNLPDRRSGGLIKLDRLPVRQNVNDPGISFCL